MIEELRQTSEGICVNCGGRIVELTGWQSEWLHDAGEDGRFRRECPGTLYAVPMTEPLSERSCYWPAFMWADGGILIHPRRRRRIRALNQARWDAFGPDPYPPAPVPREPWWIRFLGWWA